jgi:hypothetical protein
VVSSQFRKFQGSYEDYDRRHPPRLGALDGTIVYREGNRYKDCNLAFGSRASVYRGD